MPRFLCDEMLHGLGRWLRAAGYDTVIAKGGIPDRELARRCAGEDRILLTKDRHLATAAGIAPVVLVKERASTKPHEPCAPLLILTGSTRRSAAVLSTTGRLSRHRLIWRRRCRKGHAPPAAHCGCTPNAAAVTGREAMSVECSSGLLLGKARRPVRRMKDRAVAAD